MNPANCNCRRNSRQPCPANVCFRKGLKSGYKAGITKNVADTYQQGVKHGTARQKVLHTVRKQPLSTMTKDQVRHLAAERGVRNYSRMTRDELIRQVYQAGYRPL
jgi:Flp pilus assembly protein TadG